MCVGVPGEVTAIEAQVATLDVWGEARTVQLELLDEPISVGDWVLAHLGFAVRKISRDEVGPMLEAYATIIEQLDDDAAGQGEPESAPR